MTSIHGSPVLGLFQIVNTVAIGTSCTDGSFLEKGYTFTFSPVSSRTAMLEPAQKVSACESREVLAKSPLQLQALCFPFFSLAM
jgi:hypothetical protein